MNSQRERKKFTNSIFSFHKRFFNKVYKNVLLECRFEHDLNSAIATFHYMLKHFIDAIDIDLDILSEMDYYELPKEMCEVANMYKISKSLCLLCIVIITNLLKNEKYQQNNKIFYDYIQKQQRRMKLERLGELAA
jgi:hypothetical protein